jgi:hypothetical protein
MENPKLKPCRVCEKSVSSDAEKCPHCGAPLPAVKAGGTIQGVFAIAILAFLGFALWNLFQLL